MSAFARALLIRPQAPEKDVRKSIKPIVFNHKIKSSGYAIQNTPKLHGKILKKGTFHAENKPSVTDGSLDSCDWGLMPRNVIVTDVQVIDLKKPEVVLTVNSDFSIVAANFMKCKTRSFHKHCNRIRAVALSHSPVIQDSRLLVSVADDNKALLWSTNSLEPLVEIPTSFESNADASFIGQDKAFVVASKNVLDIFGFSVNEKADDLLRYTPKSKVQKYGTLRENQLVGHSIERLVCDRQSLEGRLLAACSSRKVLLWDLVHEQVAAVAHDAFKIGVSSLVMPTPYEHTFAVSARDNSVTIVDDRTMHSVRDFTGCGFSLASGAANRMSFTDNQLLLPSECGSVYVFDIRENKLLFKETFGKGAVTAVASNKSGFITACENRIHYRTKE